MILPAAQRCTYNCTADGSRWPYLVQLPAAEPQAIVVSLHGHYGDEYQMMTEEIYEDSFGNLRRECLRRNWVAVTAWYGGNSWMGPLAEAGVVDLIAVLREQWPALPLYLLGGSMGGCSALVFAVRQPQLLAGVAALCPAGDVHAFYHWGLTRAARNPTLKNVTDAIRIHYTTDGHDLEEELHARSALQHAEALTMPVYIGHGAKDALVPVRWTRQLVEKMGELGLRLVYDELPNGDHDAPVRKVKWARVFDALSA